MKQTATGTPGSFFASVKRFPPFELRRGMHEPLQVVILDVLERELNRAGFIGDRLV